MSVAELPRLIALSSGTLTSADAPRFLAALSRARSAGLPGLLLREPGLSDRAFLALFDAIRAAGDLPWIAIHDRAHLARALPCAALHVGFRSLAPGLLRPWLGGERLLGLSTHAHDDPRAWRAADYLFHGPVFETPSKRGLAEAIGMAGLGRAAAVAERPVFALGGIRPEDVGAARAAGAFGVAALGGLLGADDPGDAAAAYLDALARAG